jgi:aromatic-L-amino-acid/L-tryptophan decarboxylase
MMPASLGIVTFRRRPPGVDDEAALERINAALADEIERQGDVFISTGRVRGRYMLRLCILNYSTSQVEVDRALELAATLPVAAGSTPVAVREDYPRLAEGWLGRTSLEPDSLRSLELFSTLDDEAAAHVLHGAHEHLAAAGEAVVEQWQISRDLFVLLDGAVEVTAGGRVLNTLGPGDFFGELAALDWGAGFGRTRSATVTATEPARLLVLDWLLVNRLVRADPAFGERLEQASRERLARS